MWGLRCWLSPAAMPLARRNWGTLFQCFSFSMREQWKLNTGSRVFTTWYAGRERCSQSIHVGRVTEERRRRTWVADETEA